MHYDVDWPAFRSSVRQAAADLSLSVVQLERELGVPADAIKVILGRRRRDTGIHARVMLALCVHLGLDPRTYVKEKQ